VKIYNQDDFLKAAYNHDFDLAIASSGLTSLILDGGGGTLLLSMTSAQAPDPNAGSGAAIVVAKDRDDISNFGDLRDKRLSVMSKRAFAGWYIPLRQLENAGFANPQGIFKTISVTGDSMTHVLQDVKDGRADVGFVVTCLLENLEDVGMNADDFKVIMPRKEPNFFCATSTELYPSWVLSAAPSLSVSKAREIIKLLVNLPPTPDKGLEWTVSTDYRKMYELMEPMQEIYRHENTIAWLWDEYKWYAIVGGIIIAVVFLNSIYVGIAVRRKTTQLNAAMEQKLEAEIENQQNLSRIESLQRATAIGLISSTVAHELKQPLGAINNYVESLLRRIKRNGSVEPNILHEALSEIESEGSRAADIVEMVRNYSKSRSSAKKQRDSINLTELTQRVIQLMEKNGKVPVKHQVDLASDVYVNADPLEIELVLTNLIRNASDAMEFQKDPMLQITLKKTDVDAVLTVTDNGPPVSDEQLEKMNKVGESSKKEGLGLGLAIVRELLEVEAGSLRIVRNKDTGLSCIVKLPLANMHLGKENGHNA
ncbi:MAG: sensor histidine kinase, partial [Burkholderiales bacterium]|nr:sensor histidine kinase [Burkholderiales bacterium]